MNKIRNLLNSLLNKLLFKNSRIIKVETLLKIKENLEDNINKSYEIINKLLSSKKKEKEKSELFKIAVNKIQKLNTQLTYVKLAQQKANLKKHEDGNTNFYYIYELSNLNKFRDYLVNVKKKIASKKLGSDEFEEPNRLLTETMSKITKIMDKLAIFNQTQNIRVQIVPGLNVL